MEVSLYVNATEAPGLTTLRSSEVKKVLRRLNNKEIELLVDITKSPIELGFYDTVLARFPSEEQKNVLYISAQVNGKTIDVSKPLDAKAKDITYFVLLK